MVSKGLLRALRWLVVLPIAVATVYLVDSAVVGALGWMGAIDRSGLWLSGKLIGHVLMGALAVAIPSWVAPSHRRPTGATLWGLALFVALAALLSGELPLHIIFPLAAAFVLGATVGAAVIWRATILRAV